MANVVTIYRSLAEIVAEYQAGISPRATRILISSENLELLRQGTWPSGGGDPTAHATTHQNGGTDEISVTGLSGLLADAQTPAAHTHPESEVIGLVSDLAGKQPLDADLTTIAGLTATTDNFMVAAASAWASRTPAQAKTSLALTKTDVGLANVDNTSDANKPVSTAQQTALNLKADLASPTFTGTPSLPTGTIGVTQSAADSTTKLATTAFVTTADNLKANLASPTFTGVPAAPTAAAGTNTTQLATTAYVVTAIDGSSFRTLLTSSGSITAGVTAGTFSLDTGSAAIVSGGNAAVPPNLIAIAAADYPSINGVAPKLRIRAQLNVNNVAPTGNFTFGLYPFTRPGSSGGAGVCIYTIGTVVAGSDGATFTTPAADGNLSAVGADFALPADGTYLIGVAKTGTVAVSSHVHLVASLQLHYA